MVCGGSCVCGSSCPLFLCLALLLSICLAFHADVCNRNVDNCRTLRPRVLSGYVRTSILTVANDTVTPSYGVATRAPASAAPIFAGFFVYFNDFFVYDVTADTYGFADGLPINDASASVNAHPSTL